MKGKYGTKRKVATYARLVNIFTKINFEHRSLFDKGKVIHDNWP